MAKITKLAEPVQQAPEEQAEELRTATLGGRIFRAREPMEWTAAEADRAIELAGEQMERTTEGVDAEDEDAQRKQGIRMIAPLMKGGKYREFLALGLWEEGEGGAPVPVNEQTRARHADFFATTSLSFKDIQSAITVAFKAFFG